MSSELSEGSPRPGTLQSQLGVEFRNPELLAEALTHRSHAFEADSTSHNERLELLGDAVLGLVVTDIIFRRFPSMSEGDMAKLRAGVVNATVLAGVASEIRLGDHISLGKGERMSGGSEKQSILADAFEALLGAIYLDRGLEEARRLIAELLGDHIDSSLGKPYQGDFKTNLQEIVAQSEGVLPTYVVTSTGPDHSKRFIAKVYVGGDQRGEGEGGSKKEAEQAAAKEALTRMERTDA